MYMYVGRRLGSCNDPEPRGMDNDEGFIPRQNFLAVCLVWWALMFDKRRIAKVGNMFLSSSVQKCRKVISHAKHEAHNE